MLVPRASIEDTGVPDWGARVWWYSGFALGAAALWIVTAAWARATAARAIPRPWPWLAPLLLAGSAAATLFWMLRDFSLTSGGFGSSASHALIGALAPLELGIWALALWTVGRSARLVG